jgi:uncharacterized protein YndB with AHSA1/START domain
MEMKDFQTERIYNAPILDVFVAWTTAEKVAQWWNPFPGQTSHVAEMNVARGGNAHISAPQPSGGSPFDFYLTYFMVNPPRELSFTVRSEPQGKESPVMKVSFEEKNGKTHMTFYSPNIPYEHFDDAVQGWNTFFDKLKSVVEKPISE